MNSLISPFLHRYVNTRKHTCAHIRFVCSLTLSFYICLCTYIYQDLSTVNQRQRLSDPELRAQRYFYMQKKGFKDTKPAYVRLVTNFGNLNFELFTNRTPATVHNFLLLCQQGKYKGTIFHRLIPGFMIQVTVSKSIPLRNLVSCFISARRKRGKKSFRHSGTTVILLADILGL